MKPADNALFEFFQRKSPLSSGRRQTILHPASLLVLRKVFEGSLLAQIMFRHWLVSLSCRRTLQRVDPNLAVNASEIISYEFKT